MVLEDVEVGKRYYVGWDDCCTAGQFSAVVVRKIEITEGNPPYEFVDGIVFDNNVTMTRPFHGVVVKEVT